MELYHSFLLEVEARTEGSSLFHLMQIGHKKYEGIVNDCIQKGLIEHRGKNFYGEDLYFISSKGKKFLDNPGEELL